MACTRREFEIPPSLCFCIVSQEAININSKSKGHVHCPCEVCSGEPVYPTTAWRHIQRSKKAKFANEVQDEIDCCSLAKPTEESVDNFEKNPVYACGFHSEDTSEECCNFAENESETSSELSIVRLVQTLTGMRVRGKGKMKVLMGMTLTNLSDAILRAVEMKDQMSCSIQNFEDLLQWGKEFYLKNNNIADNATTKWPSHPCLYAVLENKEDCCPHCGKHGSIPYYYSSVTNKVKRWCSSFSMCKKMTAHWEQRDHWLPPDKKEGWGFGLKQEFWDGKRLSELSYFWNPDQEWALPVRCPQMGCKSIISAHEILESPRVAGSPDECVIECRGFYHTFNYTIRKTCGDPRNIAYDGKYL